MTMPKIARPFPAKSITDTFSEHKKRGSVNPGTDYAVKSGSKCPVVADGVVVQVKTSLTGAAGRFVRVDHGNGWHSEYLHLSKVLVKVGQRVKRGDTIALTGASGNGSEKGYGAHLHLTWEKGGRALSAKGNRDFEADLSAQSKAEKVKPVVVADPKPPVLPRLSKP